MMRGSMDKRLEIMTRVWAQGEEAASVAAVDRSKGLCGQGDAM